MTHQHHVAVRQDPLLDVEVIHPRRDDRVPVVVVVALQRVEDVLVEDHRGEVVHVLQQLPQPRTADGRLVLEPHVRAAAEGDPAQGEAVLHSPAMTNIR